MKFSQKKKAKMRKRNQKRIDKCCSNMYGCTVDYEQGYVVVDQAKIKGIRYLLAQNDEGYYAIYKIVKWCEYVKLSKKRVLENKKAFCNHVYWEEHSTIWISDEGDIERVKLGSIFGPYDVKNKFAGISFRMYY